MKEEVEYAIDEKECYACEYYETDCNDFPCIKCFGSNKKPSFKPDSIDNITYRISEI